MRLSFKCLTVLIGLFVLPYPAVAVEPVRHVGIYVEPYCPAAETPDGEPQVAVGEPFDGLLRPTAAKTSWKLATSFLRIPD